MFSGDNSNKILDKQHWAIENADKIKHRFTMYLREFNINEKENLIDNDHSSKKELIFLAVIRDFIHFYISFDMFSCLLGELWIIKENIYDFSHETHVEKMCHYGYELQWYLRNNPEKHINWLSEILEYYKENQKKLNKS